MYILLNSDVLYTKHHLLLCEEIKELCRICREQGHTIVIPETTILEFTQKQRKEREHRIGELEKAAALLRKYNVSVPDFNPEEIVTYRELTDRFHADGVEPQVVRPSSEDLVEAHRRACLHEPPAPPDSESDEMRDLVIWMIALRWAKEHGGALLLSRDKVHVHSRGDEEAAQAGLLRARDVDEAMGILGAETPAGKLIRSLLSPFWAHLKAKLPLPESIEPLRVNSPSFIRGLGGPREANAQISVRTPGGELLKARLRLQCLEEDIVDIGLWDIQIDGNRHDPDHVVMKVPTQSAPRTSDYEGRLAALREVIET